MSFRSSIGQKSIANPASVAYFVNSPQNVTNGTYNATPITLAAGTYLMCLAIQPVVGSGTGTITLNNFTYGVSSNAGGFAALSTLPYIGSISFVRVNDVNLPAGATEFSGRSFVVSIPTATTVYLASSASFSVTGSQTLAINESLTITPMF